jgi:hypothetical protein
MRHMRRSRSLRPRARRAAIECQLRDDELLFRGVAHRDGRRGGRPPSDYQTPRGRITKNASVLSSSFGDLR